MTSTIRNDSLATIYNNQKQAGNSLAVDQYGRLLTSGGGGGASSNFAAAFPAAGTAVGFNDGTNMQGAKIFDADTGVGTEYVLGVQLRGAANGGSVGLPGDATNGLLVNTGTNNAVTQSGTWNVTNVSGTITGVGATGGAVPASAFYNGAIATTANPTSATAGNIVGLMSDKAGRLVVTHGHVRELVGSQTTTLSATTTETTIATAGAAGVFNDVTLITVANTSAATTTRIDFRDATAGTIIFSLFSPPSTTVGFAPPIALTQTTSASNWTAQCATSTTDIRIFVQYVKNK